MTIIRDLQRAKELLDGMPKHPMFGSSQLFPIDRALAFNHRNRDYIGAHPLYWDRIKDDPRVRAKTVGNLFAPMGSVDVVDLDDPRERGTRDQFMQAMAAQL